MQAVSYTSCAGRCNVGRVGTGTLIANLPLVKKVREQKKVASLHVGGTAPVQRVRGSGVLYFDLLILFVVVLGQQGVLVRLAVGRETKLCLTVGDQVLECVSSHSLARFVAMLLHDLLGFALVLEACQQACHLCLGQAQSFLRLLGRQGPCFHSLRRCRLGSPSAGGGASLLGAAVALAMAVAFGWALALALAAVFALALATALATAARAEDPHLAGDGCGRRGGQHVRSPKQLRQNIVFPRI